MAGLCSRLKRARKTKDAGGIRRRHLQDRDPCLYKEREERRKVIRTSGAVAFHQQRSSHSIRGLLETDSTYTSALIPVDQSSFLS